MKNLKDEFLISKSMQYLTPTDQFAKLERKKFQQKKSPLQKNFRKQLFSENKLIYFIQAKRLVALSELL